MKIPRKKDVLPTTEAGLFLGEPSFSSEKVELVGFSQENTLIHHQPRTLVISDFPKVGDRYSDLSKHFRAVILELGWRRGVGALGADSGLRPLLTCRPAVDPTRGNNALEALSEVLDTQLHRLCQPRPAEPQAPCVTSPPGDSDTHSTLRTDLNQDLSDSFQASVSLQSRQANPFAQKKTVRTAAEQSSEELSQGNGALALGLGPQP
uniref:Uncharacterized protein n=1 Tax=Molossus molossus TaxID=27622 RepID=A0A7J8JWI3_MOLMO|nr:hypothetical protein HJG59_008088 [Molossus molossus]